ncbi:flavodoxin [Prolixibacteraceae bacterium JC049]|nr:flavodoxin [Prolixibacteraceae bacterium JC049]
MAEISFWSLLKIPNIKMDKQLIIFYSHSGITRKLAHQIQELTEGDIYEIKPLEPYPTDVWETIEIFKQELKNKSTKPIEKTNINFREYNTIFIGTPNWGNTVATPLLDFFNSVDIHDKTIVPFVTHGGGGVGNCTTDIVKLAKAKNSALPLVVGPEGVSQNEIKNWFKKKR